jgi:hypothetical protein
MNANFGSGDVSAVRWLEIDVRDWPRSVRILQDGVIGIDGLWTVQPSIMVDARRNVGLLFYRFGRSQVPTAYYTGRLATDAAGATRAPASVVAGTTSLTSVKRDRGPRLPWGNSGLALDPLDDAFWMTAAYARDPDTWGTWAGAFRLH